MKKCIKCSEIKPLTEFYREKRNKNGLRGICKECAKKYAKKYRENNSEKIKRYKEDNREKLRKVNRKWVKDNREKVRKYKENNLEKIKEYQKKWKKDNCEKIKEWIGENLEKVKEYRRKHYIKVSNTLSYRINDTIRSGIRYSLKGNKNGMHWETLVGYTKEDLIEHLEAQFEPWMNWDNYGIYEKGKMKWQIDHIKPVSSFNFTSPEDPEFKECWALENLQPLEVIENIKKGREHKNCE